MASGVAVLLMPMHSFADTGDNLQLYEQKIKAGLIYNFLKYTEWPASKAGTSNAINVCIFGPSDPFDGYLQPIEERTVNQRSIKVVHIYSTEKITDCHLLFLGNSEEGRWQDIRPLLTDKSILTVGDFRGFSDAGGMIEFDTANNRIQINLNIQAIAASHLHIYDSLRRLAKTTQSSGGRL